jgi:hypothetical protein
MRFLLLFVIVLFAINVYPQNDLQSTLQSLSKDAASSYVAPAISAFGADLNSGWVHRVPTATIYGIDVEIGVVAMGTFFSDANKTFSSTGTFQFSRAEAQLLVQGIGNQQTRDDLVNQIIQKTFNVGISGPTIAGSKNDTVKIAFHGTTLTSNGQTYNIASKNVITPVTGLLDQISALPIGAPQLTIGTFYGTSISFRYVPAIKLSDKLGDFSYFGIGFQHNPAVWLPFPLPLEVSVGFFTQTMKIGTIFSSSATTFGIFGSKTFGPSALNVTPYMGLSYESSSIDVAYDFVVDTPTGQTNDHITFNLTGENSVRLIVGASFKLAIINLNVDYNISKYNSVSAGFGFIF